MTSTARHHHYIPQVYLRGFALPGKGRNPQITVTKIKHRTQFETSARNIAGERDFNRIEVPDADPNVLENAYADFEGELGESLANIRSTNRFEGVDKDRVLNLMGLLAVRSPQMREHWRKFHEEIARHIMDLTLATKERWEGQIKQMPPELFPDGVLPYEVMKDFQDRGEYSISLNRGYQIGGELEMLDAILPLLFGRNWFMFVSDDASGRFITSDKPVSNQWIEPDKVPPVYRHSPGFGMRQTQVFFALDRHRMLVGEFDGHEGVAPASANWVALTNTLTAVHAYEQFYSAGRMIRYTDGRGTRSYHDSKILDHLFVEKQPKG